MKITSTIIILLLLTACSQNQKKQNINFNEFIAAEALESKNRVINFKSIGMQPLNNQFLLIRSSHQRSFLLKLSNKCHNLRRANSIRLNQSNDRSLSTKFDTIIVPGEMNPVCRIDNIFELNKEQRKSLLSFANQTD